MDSLQSAYKDDEEEWRDALDSSPCPSASAAAAAAAAASPSPPRIDTPTPPPLIAASPPPSAPSTALSTSPPLPPSSISPGSPAEQLGEEDNNHSPSPAEPSIPAGAALAAISDDDEDGSPARKKQKPLSTFTTPVSAPPPSAGVTIKKPKKKNNNVWTKSTSRKGKKKNKNGANGSTAAAVAPAQDAVLITPIPRFPDKSDDTPEAVICLSRVYKAEKVELGEDRLSASSSKGYRMVRATRGVEDGAWYFEIKVVRLGETGHTRLGWTNNKGDLQAPVGYDANSYGYRDIDGCKIHKALRTKCGEEGYKEGDVIGFYINLPDGESYAPKPPNLVWYKGQRYMYNADGKDEPPKVVPGSEISFFKNGIRQGAGFTDICGGRYYPAASMYTQVRPNQPNCEVRFNFGPDFEFFPEDFGGCPIPRPMIEVPYHGFEGRVEVPTENGCNPEQTS